MSSSPVMQYKVGLHNVGSYQVSGKPYVEGGINAATATSVSFPFVTNWVVVKNNSATELKVGFSANGIAGSNYMTVTSGSVLGPLELKVTALHLEGSAAVDVLAGLTFISTDSINNIANSPSSPYINWSGSSGVG